jgi:hypothetical protein
MGYVYVVKAGNGLYKIGSTSGPVNRRLSSLRTGSPMELTIEMVIATRDHSNVEGILHTQFAESRKHGEWFTLTHEDLEGIKNVWGCVPEWEWLVKWEPRLFLLLEEARGYRDIARKNPEFCANAVWYGYDKEPSMKERLSSMVGWDVRGICDPWKTLGSEESYDLAYDTIYAALPNCRHKEWIC